VVTKATTMMLTHIYKQSKQFSHCKHYRKQYNVIIKATTMMSSLTYKQSKQFSHFKHYRKQYMWWPRLLQWC